jgi:hypothetical protein
MGGNIVDVSDFDNEMWIQKLNELFDFLTGAGLPEGVRCKMPKLTKSNAMTVIWFLQEITGIIPDNYDVCAVHGDIENTDEMFYFELNNKFYCASGMDEAPVAYCGNCCEGVYKSKSYSKKHEMYLCKTCRKELDKEEKENQNEGDAE